MRKLLGYRLKNQEYYKAYSCIAFGNQCGSDIYNEKGYEGREIVIDKLKQAGVMHWFEEVYEEDEFTGWVKDDEYCINWMGYFDNGVLKYGINAEACWFTQESNYKRRLISSERPATTEEIQQALIKEAKKRGFKDKSRITDVDNDSELIDFSSPNYSSRGNWFELGCAVVFRDGKWAEILPSETLNGKTAIIDGVEYELKIK